MCTLLSTHRSHSILPIAPSVTAPVSKIKFFENSLPNQVANDMLINFAVRPIKYRENCQSHTVGVYFQNKGDHDSLIWHSEANHYT